MGRGRSSPSSWALRGPVSRPGLRQKHTYWGPRVPAAVTTPPEEKISAPPWLMQCHVAMSWPSEEKAMKKVLLTQLLPKIWPKFGLPLKIYFGLTMLIGAKEPLV